MLRSKLAFTLALLTVLTATPALADEDDALLLTGVVYTELPADEVVVRVWDASRRLLDERQRLDTPLFEGAAAPGSPFSIPLADAVLPVEVELMAKGHVALGLTVVLPAQCELPMAWLPAGVEQQLLVLRAGKPAGSALLGGQITVDSGLDGYRGQWQAVVPRTRTDERGRATVPASIHGTASVWAQDNEQHWGHTRRKLQHQSGPLRIDLDSAPAAVNVVDRLGEPLAGIHLAANHAPLGCAATTNDDGTATVQLGVDGWALIALGDDGIARRTGHGRPPKQLELTLEPPVELEVRWSGAGEVILDADWLPNALHQRQIIAEGGATTLPFFAGGELSAWAPGWRQTTTEVASADAPLRLDLDAASTVCGTVTLSDGTPAADVPIWPHLAPSFLIGKKLPAMVLRGQLSRSWRPLAVTDAAGTFSLPPLAAPSASVEARQDGMPPATSDTLDLKPGSQHTVQLILDRGTILRLRALDPGGEPLAGTSVQVRLAPPPQGRQRMVFTFGDDDRSTPPLASATTDEDGNAEVTAVPVDRLLVRLERSGFVDRELDPIEVPAEGLDLGDVVLEEGVTVSGTTVDDRGRPVGDAEVALDRSATMMLFTPTTRADGAGRFEIPDLAGEGEVYLQARAEGYVPLSPVKVELPPEGDVEVPMTRERVLTGRVVETGDRAPVAGAQLELSQQREVTVGGSMQMSLATSLGGTESDQQGMFRIPGLAPGSYSLTAQASGYRTAELAVTVPETGDPEPILVEIERGHAVDGVVLSADGQPVGGATVMATPAASQGFEHLIGSNPSVQSGADGRFRLEGLSEGRHQVVASLDDDRVTEVITVPVTAPVELRLERGRKITGRVVDPDGQPVANAEVGAFASSSGVFAMIEPTTSQADGRFRLEGVAPGQYRVYADSDVGAASEQVTVVDDADATVELRIEAGGTVTGRVVGLASAELSSCRVSAPGSGGQTVGSDGSFTLTGVTFGQQQVTAMVMPIGKMRSVAVDVEPDRPAQVEIDFAKGVNLTGTVRRAGRSAAGVVVDVTGRTQDSLTSTVTSTDGSWEVTGLEPGEYEVAARSAAGATLTVESIVLSGDGRLDLDVPGGRISGLVLADETGQPITGADVELRGLEPPPLQRALATGADGRFASEELADGQYMVTASADGWATAETTVLLSEGVSEETTLRLERSQHLDLLVREPSGRTPSSIQVLAARGGLVSASLQVACDREGRCTLEGLAPGAYTLLVSANGSRLLSVTYPGDPVSVALQPTGRLIIEAAASAGESPWRVRLTDTRTGLVLPPRPWMNPEGTEWLPVTGGRTIVPVPVGSWRVEGFAPDGTTHQQQVQVDGTTTVTFGGGTQG